MPIRAIAVIFHLSRSQTHSIIQEEIRILAKQLSSFFNMEEAWDEERCERYPKAIGIVDATEHFIQTWQDRAFSGKKGAFTLKYQVVIGIDTGISILVMFLIDFLGKVLNIYGPAVGSRHDVDMFSDSNVSYWIRENDVELLGDKGYIGCTNVITPYKKEEDNILDEHKKTFNLRLAQKRIKIENHFASLKKWKVLSHVYHGDLESHRDIFICCEILISFTE
ncbi:MAG: transposase family protein [Candidatus Bathyarchaeia archaeon]